jgi:hypothetical protein
MKTARISTKPVFVPVVLTLETEEEAEHFYTLLNQSVFDIQQMYATRHLPCPLTKQELQSLYDDYADMYRPSWELA